MSTPYQNPDEPGYSTPRGATRAPAARGPRPAGKRRRRKLGITLAPSSSGPPRPPLHNKGVLGEACRFIASNFQYGQSMTGYSVRAVLHYDDPVLHASTGKTAFDIESTLDKHSLYSGTVVLMSDPLMRACAYIGDLGRDCDTFKDFELLVSSTLRVRMLDDCISRMQAHSQKSGQPASFCEFAHQDPLYQQVKHLLQARGILDCVHRLRTMAAQEMCWSAEVVLAACDLFLAAWDLPECSKEDIQAAMTLAGSSYALLSERFDEDAGNH